MTTNERTSLEKFVDCHNSLIKDEEIRKAVGLDLDAIPMMVLPESAIRIPVFNNGMVAVSIVRQNSKVPPTCICISVLFKPTLILRLFQELLNVPELRKQYWLRMEKLLGNYVSPELLQKLMETPDEPVTATDSDLEEW